MWDKVKELKREDFNIDVVHDEKSLIILIKFWGNQIFL